ncbi:MAG: T9SS type A sorting domain-containing protein [Bacteroidota bacterium]
MLQGSPKASAQAPVPVGTEFLVNTFTPNNQSHPSVSVAPDGDFVIAWQSDNQEANYGIFAQRYAADGTPQGKEFQVNTFTEGNQQYSSVDVDADGDFVIAWESFARDGSNYDIFAQRYKADGTPEGSEFLVYTLTRRDQRRPSVGVDADGDFVIAWQGNNPNGNGVDIYAQRYTADGTPQGSEFRVNTYTPSGQTLASVGVDADGDFVIAWQSDGQDGFGFGINAQRFAADGTPQGSEFQVNTYTAINQSHPSVGIDTDGDFVIAWGSFGQDGSDYGIYAQRYAADGTPQGGEFQVNTFTPITQGRPSVAVDADGDFVISWSSLYQDGHDYGIYAQRYASDGVPQGPEFLVNTVTPGRQRFSSVGVDADGDFVIAWQSLRRDGSSFGVAAQRYTVPVVSSLSEIAAGCEFQVNTFTSRRQEHPAVAIDGDGDFIITWQSERQDNPDASGSVHAQRYASDGKPVGPEFLVNTETLRDQQDPAVAMDADGDFVIAWRSSNQDGSSEGIYAQRYTSDGIPAGTEFRVNTETSEAQFDPSVAMDADGDFIVAWTSLYQDGDGYGIFAQRFNASGVAQGTEFQVNTYTTDRQFRSSVGMDADGNFVIVWESRGQDEPSATGGYGIYGQRYAANGTPQGSEFLVNTVTTWLQRDPSIAMDADGDFVVVWTDSYQEDYSDGIYARRFDASGVAKGGEFNVNTVSTGGQRTPSVAMDSDGDFVITWSSQDSNSSNPPLDEIYAQRFARDGTPQGTEFRVNTYTTDPQVTPVVAADAAGDFVVVWRSGEAFGASQDGSAYGVFAQRYALTQPSIEGGTYSLPVLGFEGWRMLAQPNGTTLATLLSSVWTQGLPGADTPNGEANVLIYDESNPAADEDIGFIAPTSLVTSTPGQGFIVYLFADDDPTDGEGDIDGGFPKALSAPYTAPVGTVSPAATFTDNGTPDADGWNLLGNPFAEPLSWDAVRANAGFQNVEATVYVWDPKANAYRTWNGSSGDLLGGEIAGGQGFFVKAAAANPALPFTAGDTGIIDGRTYSAYSRVGTPFKLEFELDTEIGQARAFVEAGFGGEQARDGKDGYLLAPLSGTFAQLYTRPLTEDAADPLAINSLDLDALTASETAIAIPLGVAAFEAGGPAGGTMTLRWPETLLPEGWRAELHDTKTGAVVDLTEVAEYTFTLETATQPDAPELAASEPTPGTQAVPPLLAQGLTNPVARVAAADRFELVLTPASVVATDPDTGMPGTLTLDGNYPNPFSGETTLRYGLPESATVSVAVYDVLGREVLVVQDGLQQAGWYTLSVDAAWLPAGVYMWRVEAVTAAGREASTRQMLIVK